MTVFAVSPSRAAETSMAVGHASDADEPAVRRLLREQVMGGRIGLSLQCEPDLRRALAIQGDRQHVFVALDATGRVVATGSRTCRPTWVNGEMRRVGYLGHFRRDPGVGRRRQLLQRGFAAIKQARRADELTFDITSIAVDNAPARRLLERAGERLAGMPRYQPLCEFVTLLIPTRRRSGGVTVALPEEAGAITACVAQHHRRHQFAPTWSTDHWRTADHPAIGDVHVHRRSGRISACVARWDQRAIKQAMVRRYRGVLRWGRTLINTWATMRGRPRLPAVGQAVGMVYLSHMAADDDNVDLLLPLIDQARRAAPGADWLACGFTADHPMRRAIEHRYRRAGLRSYRTMIYLVHYDDAAGGIAMLDDRRVHLEVATL